mmetsp:Transcript_24985/g.56963  ORF Transcript_24985/g.56963 Transcript_24985/m.56963 type:complete len:171 (+) Transcript_24985:72-584(+)
MEVVHVGEKGANVVAHRPQHSNMAAHVDHLEAGLKPTSQRYVILSRRATFVVRLLVAAHMSLPEPTVARFLPGSLSSADSVGALPGLQHRMQSSNAKCHSQPWARAAAETGAGAAWSLASSVDTVTCHVAFQPICVATRRISSAWSCKSAATRGITPSTKLASAPPRDEA